MNLLSYIFIYMKWVSNNKICNLLIQPFIVSFYLIVSIYQWITFDNLLQSSYILKRNQGSYFSACKFYSFITSYSISHIDFYSTQSYKKTSIDSQQKKPSIWPPVFLNQIYNKTSIIFSQKNLISEIGQTVPPQ